MTGEPCSRKGIPAAIALAVLSVLALLAPGPSRAADVDMLEESVARAYAAFKSLDEGETAQYIPALAQADSGHFGLVIMTVDGQVIAVGDTDVPFAIMSAAKPFTLALLLSQKGRAVAPERIGVEPTGLPFNDLSGIRRDRQQPMNPMVNAGAITTVSLLDVASPEQRWPLILNYYGDFAGEPLALMGEVYQSVSTSNYQNRALVNLLQVNGWLGADPTSTLDVYNKQSCVSVTARQLATMGATLANRGINPVTGKTVLDSELVDEVLSVMLLSGFYDESGRWAYNVGLPAKSGVGGGIVAVVPGRMALVAYSPRLSPAGNSVRGMRAIAQIAGEQRLSLLKASPAPQNNRNRAHHETWREGAQLMTMPRLPVTLIITLLLSQAVAAALPKVDGGRLNATMETLKTFGGNEQGGSDRVAYSEANLQAILYLVGLMGEAGLATHIDPAGNLVGRRAGRNPDAAVILTGSHIDTVPNGGHYDGIVGVMAAIEVARTLHDAGVELEHPVEFVAWSNEERGKFGSRSLAEHIPPRELALTTYTERSVAEGMRLLGGNPDKLGSNRRRPGDIAAFIELHVEQGGILEQTGKQIGVVTGIVGIKRWKIDIEGTANHAGTTPMNQRQDAAIAAARMILAINRVATGREGSQVATVGIVRVEPGAANVVPGRAELHLEIRDLSMTKIDSLYASIAREAGLIADVTGTSIDMAQYYETDAALSDPAIMAIVEDAAKTLQYSAMEIPSGAGHDAQSFKTLAPLGMIFIPSQGGISHSPEEFTKPGDITRGANVLLHTIIGLDRQPPRP